MIEGDDQQQTDTCINIVIIIIIAYEGIGVKFVQS